MSEALMTEINIIIPVAVEIIVLLFIVLLDPYLLKKQKRIMLVIIGLVILLIVHELLSFYYTEIDTSAFKRTIITILGYSIRPAIIVLFCYIVDDGHKYIIEWIMVAVNIAINMTALFSHICFWIEDKYYMRGPLGYTCHIVSAILAIRFLGISVIRYEQSRKIENSMPICSTLLIFVAVYIDSFGGELRFFQVPILLPVIVNDCVILYIWLHLQYVRIHENGIMTQQRIKTMISQIQPHFIYNSLNVIGSYLDEPQKAENALENFTGFLRGSIDLLNSEECIAAAQEFKTVEHFLYLEKERFGDKLNVVMDIKDTDFYLPSFTVQTLVENAISHGIRRNKAGRGTLILKSYKEKKMHVIEVQDDGVGFPKKIDWNDGPEVWNSIRDNTDDHSHIGLANLSERLDFMCNAGIRIKSTPGQGTIVKVIIP